MDTEEKYKQLKQALANTPVDAVTQNDIVKKIDSGFQKAYQVPDEVQVWTLNEYNSIPALTSLDLSALTSADIQAWSTPNTAPFANSSVTLGGSGGSGAVYSISGVGGGGSGSVVYPSTTTGTGNWQKPYGTGKIKIEAEDIEIQGKSLLATLERIEQRLGILDCDDNLEQHWDELKSLGEKYRELKQHIEDKMKTFETLKKMPKPEIK